MKYRHFFPADTERAINHQRTGGKLKFHHFASVCVCARLEDVPNESCSSSQFGRMTVPLNKLAFH